MVARIQPFMARRTTQARPLDRNQPMIRHLLCAALLIAGTCRAETGGGDPLHVAGLLPKAPQAASADDMYGFAKLAGTTGGAGRPVFTVTAPGDDDPDALGKGEKRELKARTRFVKYFAACPSNPSSLTLREALTCALFRGGGVIAFSPALPGHRVDADRSLYIPDNVTIDGGGVTIASPWKSNVLQIYGVSNVIVTHVAIRQSSLIYRYGHCIDVFNADRVWIAHNDIGFCGEGGVYVNQGGNLRPDGLPKASNVTIAYNHIHDIGKVFAIGQLECEPSFGKQSNYKPPSWCIDATPFVWDSADPAQTPFIHVTIQGNLLNGVGERAPRVGAAYVDMVDNVIAYRHYIRATTDQDHPVTPEESAVEAEKSDDRSTAAFGGVVSGGAHLYGTNNLYLSLEGSDNPALCAPQSASPHCKSRLTLADGTVVQQSASVNMTGMLVQPEDVFADAAVNAAMTPKPPYPLLVQMKFRRDALNDPASWACLARHVGANSSGRPACGGQ
jgi:pectate lyase